MHTGPYEKKAHYFIDDIVPWDDGTYIGGVDGNVWAETREWSISVEPSVS